MRASSTESTAPTLGIITVLLLGALLLRLHLLFASNFVIDSDEAIVGLMARHILSGGAVPIFYYGQPYMGSLEALGAALTFAVFGESNFSLQLVPLFFGLLLVPVVYLLGLHAHSRMAGIVAATFVAVPPQALLVWSVKARGGFIELVLIAATALLVAFLWAKDERRSGWWITLLGFLVGIGWWVNNQMVFYVPALVLIFLSGAFGYYRVPFGVRLVLFLRQSLLGLFGFLVGSLPFWVYNLTSEPRFETFKFLLKPAEKGRVGEYLWGFLTTSVPILFGARGFWQREDLFTGASIIVWTLYGSLIVALIALIIRARKRGTALPIRPLEAILIVILTTVTIFSVSSFGWLAEAPRYLLPLYPVVFVGLGTVLAELLRWSRRVGGLLLAGILTLHLYSIYPGYHAIPGEPFVYSGERVSRDHTALYDWFRSKGVTWIRTNYWIGYRVAFETQESVRFRVFQAPQQERIEQYQAESPALDTLPLVLVPAEYKLIAPALSAMGWEYQREELSGYVVLHQWRRVSSATKTLPCGELIVTASEQTHAAKSAADCTVDTRWGSGKPQSPGMELSVRLSEPRVIRGLQYDLGAFRHDYPRGLRIILEALDGEEVVLVDEVSWPGIRYLLEERSVLSFAFPPRTLRGVRLQQTGSDPIFDWSVAELQLLE
jgi:4-amino-4-deoxy-L-arabinose transferase-like glycosyltransferase